MTMSQTLRVVQAFDRAVIMDIPTDDSQALETKLASAARMMRERDAWLKPYQRSTILQGAAGLLAARQADFARPWSMAAMSQEKMVVLRYDG
jgi:acyl-CoA reductase-like NAD-dependent aldehyde dehydrogenase